MTQAGQTRVPLWAPGQAGQGGQPQTVRVEAGAAGYDIAIGDGLMAQAGELARAVGAQRGLLVADAAVAELYGAQCQEGLAAAGCAVELAAVPSGESSKSLAMAERLYGACLNAKLDRGATVFALGGGVVCDLAGFVAGTFMRGVRFITIPTTLLAQVDASVGGKTAVDLPQAKNAVGVFHQPALVVMDVGTLATLPEREFLSGLAEIVKHAMIADAEMFGYLRAQAPAVLRRETQLLRPLVARNCQIKAEVVAADPEERGWRAVLNFGHTVGHALERAAGEWELRHGEAVALGMLAETRLAERLGLAEAGLAESLRELLQALGLAREGLRLNAERAVEALAHDKKLSSGRLRLPLVPRPGEVALRDDVSLQMLAEATAEACGEAS